MTLLALVGLAVYVTRRTTPEPPSRAACHRCDARFTDQRGLSWHVGVAHPVDYEVCNLRRLK